MENNTITNPAEQVEMGDRYYHGDGVEQDYEQAIFWYTKAAEQGNADAQYNLGLMYYYGDGAEEDWELGWEWIEKAAIQGHEEAFEMWRGDGDDDGRYDGYV